MSVDVEALIQKITAEVTKQVLAAVASEPTVDEEWPEWDEFNGVQDVAVSPSPLRSRLSGVVDDVIDDDEDDEVTQGTMTAGVVPLGETAVSQTHGGFDPRSNPSWFEVQYRREVLLPSRVVSK